MTSNGSFSGSITGLSPAVTYYYRSEAVGHGTGKGQVKSFTTLSTPPSVTTDNASNIGHYNARLNGNLDSLGTAPSVNVSFQWGTGPGNYSAETTTQALGSAGSFYSDLSGLTDNTTYYYRTKAIGHGTVYGSEKIFTTLAGGQIPTAITDNATNVTYNSARLNCSVTSLGTAQSAQVHFVWGTAPGVYTGTSQSVPVIGIGSVSIDVGSLSASTTYYYRAYVSFLFTPGDGGGFLADYERTFTTSAAPVISGGGGFSGSPIGGGGGTVSGPGVISLSPYISYDGHFNLAAVVNSDDSDVSLSFAKGVLARTTDDNALKSIKIVVIDSPAAAPSGSQFIGLVYEMTPDGATFSPGITLTIFYDPATLPEGIDPNSLKIAVFNTTTSAWETLQSTINKADSSITATIEHLSVYTIVGKETTTPATTKPVFIPLPARFTTSDLMISPGSASPGQTIDISTRVSNTGETQGSMRLSLRSTGR